ncbi:MAG: tyrosine-type recombinase/integrase [Actinomycetota bacterium]|nr:tyrosine-type recombinase/integrase [Actinomycetota bacterium]
MTALADHAARYLAVRRALGYKLSDTAPLIESLIAHVEAAGAAHLSATLTLQWAAGAGSDGRYTRRLSVARRFAAYLVSFDPATEIAPRGLRPDDRYGRPPHIYTDEEIGGLVAAARVLEPAGWASSVATAIGLAATCGLRPAEIYRLRVGDVDLADGRLAVRDSKGGRSRLLPLHATTVDALGCHLGHRGPGVGVDDALFATATGTPLTSAGFTPTFRRLAARVAIPPGRARLGDLRHTFAVTTLVAWHRAGVDVNRRLPALSAYLGHARPASTYWYYSDSRVIPTSAPSRA